MALLPRVIDIDAKGAAELIRGLDWTKLTQLDTPAAKEIIDKTLNQLIALFQEPYRRKVRRTAAASNVVRGIAIALGICGAVVPTLAPCFAADRSRWIASSVGLSALLLASGALLVDQVYGWSRAVVRFGVTVQALQGLALRFQLSLATLAHGWGTRPTSSDIVAGLALFQGVASEALDLLATESSEWASEVNSGLSALGEFVKAHREGASQAATAAAAAAAKQEEAKLRPTQGALEILLPPGDAAVTAKVDDGPAERAIGRRAVLSRVDAGLRRVRVEVAEQATAGAPKPPWVAEAIVVVAAGAVSRLVLAADGLLSEPKG